MAIRPILSMENPILRQKAKRIKHIDKSLDPMIQDMLDTMHDAPGIGLAAPQIGIPLRLMIIEIEDELTTLINPEIVKTQGEWEPEEGCLSIPGYVANVKRAWAVTVKAKNRQGRDVRLKGEGLFGQALQHEIDHLDGILYVDRLDDMDALRKIEPGRKGRRRTAEPEPAPEVVAEPVA
jgi:peptide deformylase